MPKFIIYEIVCSTCGRVALTASDDQELAQRIKENHEATDNPRHEGKEIVVTVLPFEMWRP